MGDRPEFAVVDNGLHRDVAVIQGGYKLVNNMHTNSISLFDLKHDPRERVDLYARKPEVAERLKRLLNFWMACQITYYSDPRFYENYYPPSYD